MSKRNKSVSIGQGLECPKCDKPMVRKEPKKDNPYFLYWDYCVDCRHVQHYPRAINPNREVESENDEAYNLFKNL